MKTDINIYIITSEYLKNRFNHLNYQLNKFKDIFIKLEFNINFIQINNPSNKDIEKTIDIYKERVNVNKNDIEDIDFKKIVSSLNTHQYQIILNNKRHWK